MKSAIASAALGAALLTQATFAASIAHSHQHLHHRAAAAHQEKRGVAYMSDADVSTLQAQGILVGKNVRSSVGGSPITIGDNGGPYVVEFTNKSPDDLIVVVWSASAADPYLASFVKSQQADVTHTLQSNTSTYVSFDPSQNGGSISGAWSAIYPGATTNWVGQIDNTWGEYTYISDSVFSTTDVSRLVNMNGNPMEIHNYACREDAENDAVNPACSSTMSQCSFVCGESLTTCIAGTIQNCAVGTANTDSDASGMDGGCTGMSSGGFVKVIFS